MRKIAALLLLVATTASAQTRLDLGGTGANLSASPAGVLVKETATSTRLTTSTSAFDPTWLNFVSLANCTFVAVNASGNLTCGTYVTSSMIQDATIITGDIATGGVTSANILDSTITSADLGSGSVTNADVASDAITSAMIVDGTITSGDIADATISFMDISNNFALNSDLSMDTGESWFAWGESGIIFEGVADNVEGALSAYPTGSDKTWTLPNVSGTIVTTGDTSSITSTMLAPGSVTNADVANDAITSAMIVDSTITSADLGSGSVTNADVANDAITSAMIVDSTITSADLGSGSVTNADVANDAITSSMIIDSTITSADLGSGSVTNADVANDAITSAMIVDGTITSGDIADATISFVDISNNFALNSDLSMDTGEAWFAWGESGIIFEGVADNVEGALSAYPTGSDKTWTLPNVSGTIVTTGDTSSITSTMLAPGSVTSADVANDAITSAMIVDSTITSADLGSGSVTSADVANDAITSAMIVAETITNADIGAGAVGASEIASAAVSYDKIQNVAAGTLLGRNNSTSGQPQEISPSAGLSLTGTSIQTVSWISPADFATDGVTLTGTVSGPNVFYIRAIQFPDTFVSTAYYIGNAGPSWDASSISVKLLWTANSTSASDTVYWRMSCRCTDNAQAININTGFSSNTDLAQDYGDTAAYSMVETSDLTATCGNTCSAGDLVQIRITRVGNDASDDMTVAALVVGVQVVY